MLAKENERDKFVAQRILFKWDWRVGNCTKSRSWGI